MVVVLGSWWHWSSRSPSLLLNGRRLLGFAGQSRPAQLQPWSDLDLGCDVGLVIIEGSIVTQGVKLLPAMQ